MAPLGIIGGTNLIHSRIIENCKELLVDTDHGEVTLLKHQSGNVIFLPRHGTERWRPPHMVNHHGNISALRSCGVTHILGITSVGSLKKDIVPGEFLVPEDYIQLSNIPTFYHDEVKFITPSLCEQMRNHIFEIGRSHGFPVHMGGIYLQTTGPRFETRAEVRFFSGFADVVGMNMASEATLSNEADMEYANISVVDNFGNGLQGEIIYEDFMNQVRKHQDTMDRFLEILIPKLQKAYK